MSALRIEKTSFYNNPFVGLFVKTNDKTTLLPKNATPRLETQAKSALGTEIVKTFVDQSPLLGVFCCINNNGCVVQENASKEEQDVLKKQGLNVFVLKNYSPGNNILANNKACLLNPEIPAKDAARISDCLGVEAFRQKIGVKTVGAVNVVTDKGLLAHNETSEVELKYLEKIFSVRGLVGTSNFGQTYNGFSVVANNEGAIAGFATTGIEVQRIFEALGG